MNFALFGRFFLEFAMMYPAEYLCLASLQEHLRAPRKTYAIGASAITLMGLAGAAVCCMLDIETNFLLIPLLIISFWLLRWRTDREVSISQTMFLFSVSAVMMSVCTLLAIVLNAEAELDNAQPVFLPSTSVICLTLSVILSAIFRFTAVRWSRWLLQEYHGEAFWESAWPLYSGRRTELCSHTVVITWPPGRINPLIAVLRACVALEAKAIQAGLSAWNSSASASRVP